MVSRNISGSIPDTGSMTFLEIIRKAVMSTGKFHVKHNGKLGTGSGWTPLGFDTSEMRRLGWTPKKTWRFTPVDGTDPYFVPREELEIGNYAWEENNLD